MRLPALDSFRTQVALIAVASLSVAALAVVLVRDALLSSAERLVQEAKGQCAAAAEELREQYLERARFQEQRAGALPVEAQDVSLRGLTAAVLRSYSEMSGGFVLPGNGIVGAVSPQPLADEELAWLRSLAPSGVPVSDTRERGRDVAVAAVTPVGPAMPAAWTLKRLSGVRDPGMARRRWWLAALVILALASVAGIISISMRLRRGVDAISGGLARLEEDFSYRLAPVRGDLGLIARAINRMADRRAELDTQIRRQDRLAALGKVVSGVAHEIRNPLNSVRLTLELLQRRVNRGAATGAEVSGAMEEVDRLDRILSRLLAFGKPGFEDRRVQPVRPILERAAGMVEQQAHTQQVRVTVTGERVTADVDADQIEQVLINLLLNAIDASPPGGEVRVDARPEDGTLRIAVHDDGPGVAANIRDHIFDPYFTTKETGNGLGLAVSREVAARHGGTLELLPDGRGATFVLHVPLHRRPA